MTGAEATEAVPQSQEPVSPAPAVNAAPPVESFTPPAPVTPAPVAPAPVDVPSTAAKPDSTYTVWSSSPNDGRHFGPKE